MRPLSRDEIRAIDARAAREYHLPTLVLMENAGRGAAEYLRGRIRADDQVFVACGAGNNGGDGCVVARYLDAWNHPVRIGWFCDPARLTGDAAIQKQICDAADIPQSIYMNVDITNPWDQATWIVDALLGTGLTRPVEGPLYYIIESMNQSKLHIISLDIPSGLDADSGQPRGIAVRADCTATFVAPKLGFSQPSAREYTGHVEVVEIGLPAKLLRSLGENSIGQRTD